MGQTGLDSLQYSCLVGWANGKLGTRVQGLWTRFQTL
jgi:hypothetical protein